MRQVTGSHKGHLFVRTAHEPGNAATGAGGGYYATAQGRQTSQSQTIWRCRICGYEYVGEELPDDFICPLCKHPASDFEKVVKKTEVKEMAANKYAGTQIQGSR